MATATMPRHVTNLSFALMALMTPSCSGAELYRRYYRRVSHDLAEKGIYTTLRRLARNGLIIQHAVPGVGSEHRYELTADGRATVDHMRERYRTLATLNWNS